MDIDLVSRYETEAVERGMKNANEAVCTLLRQRTPQPGITVPATAGSRHPILQGYGDAGKLDTPAVC